MLTFENQYNIGDLVSKTSGDYKFDGTVVASFQKLSGLWRYVVEDDRGILHIFSEKNLKPNIIIDIKTNRCQHQILHGMRCENCQCVIDASVAHEKT